MTRPVDCAPRFQEEVMRDFDEAPVDCLAGADLVLRELEGDGPDIADRCGLLDDRHEVYALRLPGCSRLRLFASFDLGLPAPGRVTIHGLGSALHRPCDAARARAVRHLELVDPVWEKRNG